MRIQEPDKAPWYAWIVVPVVTLFGIGILVPFLFFATLAIAQAWSLMFEEVEQRIHPYVHQSTSFERGWGALPGEWDTIDTTNCQDGQHLTRNDEGVWTCPKQVDDAQQDEPLWQGTWRVVE